MYQNFIDFPTEPYSVLLKKMILKATLNSNGRRSSFWPALVNGSAGGRGRCVGASMILKTTFTLDFLM